jgi:hypothetical protein
VKITDNGHSIAGIGAPPGDDSDEDLAYLLNQSAGRFGATVPDSLGAGAFAAVLLGLLLLRRRAGELQRLRGLPETDPGRMNSGPASKASLMPLANLPKVRCG